jgi:hypothetical protein
MGIVSIGILTGFRSGSQDEKFRNLVRNPVDKKLQFTYP